MLTKTSEIGIQALAWLAIRAEQQENTAPAAPREIAAKLGSSPTYTAKVVAILVRAGILRSFRGALGGVTLAKASKDITLLAVVEACQGKLIADFCTDSATLPKTCHWHQAMWEWHQATIKVLSHWTVYDLLCKTKPDKALKDKAHCRLGFLHRQQPGD